MGVTSLTIQVSHRSVFSLFSLFVWSFLLSDLHSLLVSSPIQVFAVASGSASLKSYHTHFLKFLFDPCPQASFSALPVSHGCVTLSVCSRSLLGSLLSSQSI
eukprot:m.219469 g.219469  ORF g.219469 m.219469 type:complete len:102 (+) comp39923_c1_seq19:56-361(+)